MSHSWWVVTCNLTACSQRRARQAVRTWFKVAKSLGYTLHACIDQDASIVSVQALFYSHAGCHQQETATVMNIYIDMSIDACARKPFLNTDVLQSTPRYDV